MAHQRDRSIGYLTNLAARLPYLFACCRFAHYLKCIVRDKVGSFKERDDMQRWLQHVAPKGASSTPEASTPATITKAAAS